MAERGERNHRQQRGRPDIVRDVPVHEHEQLVTVKFTVKFIVKLIVKLGAVPAIPGGPGNGVDHWNNHDPERHVYFGRRRSAQYLVPSGERNLPGLAKWAKFGRVCDEHDTFGGLCDAAFILQSAAERARMVHQHRDAGVHRDSRWKWIGGALRDGRAYERAVSERNHHAGDAAAWSDQ